MISAMRSLASAVALTVLAAVPAAAQDDDLLKRAVNQPGTNWTFYGQGLKTKMLTDKDLMGGAQAVRITVPAKGTNGYDSGAQSPIQKPIAKGDLVYLSFWARAPMLKDAETALITSVSVGQNTAPYSKAVEGTATLTNKWAIQTVKAISPVDLPAGQATVGVNLADNKQVLELGPVFVLDYGPQKSAAK